MTLRPIRFYRWGASLFMVAVGGGLVGIGFWDSITGGSDDVWGAAVFAVLCFALAAVMWSAYIRADDSAIVVGIGVTRRYDRRDVAGMRIGRFELGLYTGSGRRVRFLRSDGSTVFTTYLAWWGQDQMEALATYLGVPIDRST